MFSPFQAGHGTRSARSSHTLEWASLRRLGQVFLVALVALGAIAPSAYADGDPVQGKPLFEQYCVGCHGPSGQGGRKNGFMPRPQNLTKKGYIELLPDAYLFTVISKGGAAAGKSDYMPAFEGTLGKEDMESLIAYIRTLAPH